MKKDATLQAAQKAKIGNLKEFNEIVNYLMQNKLTTPEELQERVSALSDRIDTLKSSMRGKSERMKELDELLRMVQFYTEGKPVADTKLRDTENVPMTEDIQTYFEREVLPYAPDAWIDEKKTKTGYEIPMTRYFYEYQPPEPVESIVERINALEKDIADSLNALFNREG